MILNILKSIILNVLISIFAIVIFPIMENLLFYLGFKNTCSMCVNLINSMIGLLLYIFTARIFFINISTKEVLKSVIGLSTLNILMIMISFRFISHINHSLIVIWIFNFFNVAIMPIFFILKNFCSLNVEISFLIISFIPGLCMLLGKQIPYAIIKY